MPFQKSPLPQYDMPRRFGPVPTDVPASKSGAFRLEEEAKGKPLPKQ